MKMNIDHTLAVFDLGSNTLKLLIADLQQGRWEERKRLVYPCRIGEGITEGKRLTAEAKARTLEALHHCLQVCKDQQVTRGYMVATEGLRFAQDGADFVRTIREETGLQFTIITGEQEAILSEAAAVQCMGMPGNSVLIFDIGGGSTELIIRKNSTPSIRLSMKLGAIRLRDLFLKNEPLTDGQVTKAASYVKTMLSETMEPISLHDAIGIGGSVSTVAAVYHGGWDQTTSEHWELTPAIIEKQLAALIGLTPAQRSALPGMTVGRSDILPAGAIIIRELMDYFQVQHVRICNRGMRFGLLEAPLPEIPLQPIPLC